MTPGYRPRVHGLETLLLLTAGCLQDFETEFTRDEKFIGKELRGAIDYIEGIESRYKEPTWLQRLSQTLHLPFASQSIPKP